MKESDKLYIKFAVKLLVFLLGAYIWVMLVYSMVNSTVDELTGYYNSDAFIVNTLDEYYYEKQYGNLYDDLILFQAQDDMYDVYWEVMNAYIDVQEYRKWSKVPVERMEEAEQMAEKYRNKVIKNAQNPKFPQNQKYLDEFVEMLDRAK